MTGVWFDISQYNSCLEAKMIIIEHDNNFISVSSLNHSDDGFISRYVF